jgi:hypothetical protein
MCEPSKLVKTILHLTYNQKGRDSNPSLDTVYHGKFFLIFLNPVRKLAG